MLFSLLNRSSLSNLQSGPVEYKRQILHGANSTRLRSLATQLSYRLDQGHGTCRYRLGVEDDGCHSLLPYEAVAESAKVLECLARSLNAVVTARIMIQGEVLPTEDANAPIQNPKAATETRRFVEEPLFRDGTTEPDAQQTNGASKCASEMATPGIFTRAEISIHRIETHLLEPSPKSMAELTAASDAPSSSSKRASSSETSNSTASSNTIAETLSTRNIRVAVVGNVDAGKSTLIGTLTTSHLDDGRGKSRTAIMKHRHEIESGRTSTATTHLMGFSSSGRPVMGRDAVRSKRKTEDEVARESYRIITLMDLAGHEKYLKTTCV